jgi:ABC-type Fe3+ transport system substrate-binding protein
VKQVFKLVHDTARVLAVRALQKAPEGYVVTISEPLRSLDANAAQWPYLQAFAEQKELCINGAMVKATPEDWKDVLTGVYNGETRMAAYDGRVIMLPQRTSKMGKKQFGEWLEFLMAMAAQAGVKVYEDTRENTYINSQAVGA